MDIVFVRKDILAMVLSVFTTVRVNTLGVAIDVYRTYPVTMKVKIQILIKAWSKLNPPIETKFCQNIISLGGVY